MDQVCEHEQKKVAQKMQSSLAGPRTDRELREAFSFKAFAQTLRALHTLI